MEIRSTLTTRSGRTLAVTYRESDPLKDLDGRFLAHVGCYCFCGDKLVVVYAEKKGFWTPPGGGIEPGETFEQAVTREVKEETNMKVMHQKLIGYQDIEEPGRIIRQTRSFCIVEPYGDFVSDPDGDITEIRLIDPSEYKKYFDWGVVGDRIMDQALAMKRAFDLSPQK